MTVSSTTDRATFPGNGVAQIFPLPFRFFANSDIQVWLVTNATGVLTPQTIGVHYTLTGANDPEVDGSPTSSLTMLTAPTALESLFVQRVVPLTQPTDLINQGRFFPETHETVFDRLTMLLQQAVGESKGAIRVAIGDPEPARLPNAISRALQLMAFDSLGNPVTAIPATGSSADLALNLLNATDPAKGAAMVGYKGRTVYTKLNDELSFVDFGILGDGTNETTKLQTAFVTAAGKVLRAEPGKTYFTTDELQIPSNAIVDFCGSRLRYTIDVTGKSCIRFRDCRNSDLRNVDIEPIGSMTVAPNTGDSRMPVVVGVYDAHSPTEFCENITIENVKVIGGFDAMNGIAVFGRSNNIRIINPSVEGTVAPASAGIGILAHWSADNIAAPTVTYHPRNIHILNPKFRKCALGASAEQASIIFLSGAFNVEVDNVDADDVNTGVYVYPGDFGFTFSNDPAATQVRGITIDGGSIANVRKFGINVLGQANGVGPRLPMGVHVRNVRSDGADAALRTRRVGVGVVFDGAAAFGATQGILFSESDDAIAINCDITGNAQQGVYFASSNRCRLVGSKVYGNNTSNLANQLGSAVYLDGTCADNDICDNHIGAQVGTEYYGCRVNGATVTNTKINDNTFYNFTTNVAIQNDAAPYTAKTNGSRNVFVGSSLLAAPVTPPMIHYDSYGRATVRANAAPVVGTWKVGDRFVNSIPTVGQPKAWSCTVAGTPGTWVSEGNL